MAALIERIVDAHVHLWDPARANWYPYLAGRQELDMGDVSGMIRRFDQPTYFSESANYNVVKFVHVAADRGPLGRGDRGAGGAGRSDRPPGRHHRRHRARRPDRRHRAVARRADGLAPVPRHPADGRRVRRSARRRLPHARGTRPGVRAHGASRPARKFGRRARRLGRAHRRGRARGWPRDDSPGVRAVEARYPRWRPWATTCTAGCAWPCRSTRWKTSVGTVDRALPRLVRRRPVMFASNFPVDAMHAHVRQLCGGFDRVTADLGAGARVKLFTTNAEPLYRC